MFRKLLVPATSTAALLALFLVLSPTGAKGQARAENAYFFNTDGAVSRPTRGSVQVYGGAVDIRDVVAGDLLVIGGSVRFSGRGRVEGNLIHAASTIESAEGRIGGRIYPLASLEGAAGALTKNAVVASLLLVWLLTAVVMSLVSGREIRHSSLEVRTSALHCFVLGLVAITSFVLTAIAFSYLIPYVIGIPLLAALGVFAILAKVYGMIAVFHAIGTLVAAPRNRAQLTSRRWLRGDVAMVVVGVLILGAIRFVPVIGPMAWGISSVFGVGVALATRFGRREPWFLALRTSEA